VLFVLSLGIGAVRLSPQVVVGALLGRGDEAALVIVREGWGSRSVRDASLE